MALILCLKVSNLNYLEPYFAGFVVFKIPMCDDFVTKVGTVIYKIILIIKFCSYTSGNEARTTVSMKILERCCKT